MLELTFSPQREGILEQSREVELVLGILLKVCSN